MTGVKTIPCRADIHAQLVNCAKSRGMTIQGLHERILRSWLAGNFFGVDIARDNNAASVEAGK